MNIRTIALLILTTTLIQDRTANAAAFVQWPVASGGNGHFYAVTDSALTWTAAESVAISLGGHLVSITSAAEQTFITTTFLNGAFDFRPLWIGLTDLAPNGGGAGSRIYTRWTTGENVVYTNWNNAEPNNTSPGEDYGTMNWQRANGEVTPKGTWNDTPNSGTTFGPVGPYFGIVEVVQIVPEPSSTLFLLSGAALCLRRRTLRTNEPNG